MSNITLEPGGASERLCLQFKLDPAVTLSRRAVATFLGITPALVDNAVQAAVGLGLIASTNDMDHGRIYKAGPRLGSWTPPGTKPAGSGAIPQAATAPSPAPAPAAAADASPAAAAKKVGRGGKRKHLPELQLSLLKVEKGLPLPVAKGLAAKGQTKYDNVFNALKADDDAVTGIPKIYKPALQKAVQTYLANRPALKAKSALVIRDTDDEHCGVWRVAKGTVGTQAGKALKAA